MIAVDTCVLARFVIGDDPAQQDVAKRLIDTERVYAGWTVLIELGWVLGRSLRMPRSEVADALEVLFSITNVFTPDPEGVDWALERYRAGADWADSIHLVSNREHATEFATFDQGIALEAGSGSPLAVRTLIAPPAAPGS